MNRVISFALLALLAWAPVHAITIKPGTYKLQWQIPEEDACPIQCRAFLQKVNQLDTGLPKVQGTVSSNACLGRIGKLLWLVLDESKGTDEGYDTAYLIPITPTQALRVNAATAIALQNHDGAFSNDSVPITILTGNGKVRVQRKVTADIYCQLLRVRHPRHIAQALVRLHGHWCGSLKTDSGTLEVEVFDGNANGIYGDLCLTDQTNEAFLNNTGPLPCDAMVFGGLEAEGDEALADVVAIQGKLYQPQMSRDGSTFTIKPYTGAVGKIKLLGTDGYGKPTSCRTYSCYNRQGGFLIEGNKPNIIPVGDYTLRRIEIDAPGTGKWKRSDFSFVTQDKRIARVREGQTLTVRAGGPLKMELAHGLTALTITGGSDAVFGPCLTVGGIPVDIHGNGIPAMIGVRNSEQKEVFADKMELRYLDGNPTKIHIPTEWQPGSYELSVTLDTRPYQPPVTSVKKLIVK